MESVLSVPAPCRRGMTGGSDKWRQTGSPRAARDGTRMMGNQVPRGQGVISPSSGYAQGRGLRDPEISEAPAGDLGPDTPRSVADMSLNTSNAEARPIPGAESQSNRHFSAEGSQVRATARDVRPYLEGTRPPSSLTDCEVEAVLAAIGYYASDVEALRDTFVESLPEGNTAMDRASFRHFMSSLGLNLEGEALERYFSAFDSRHNGQIDAREFLLGLAASDPQTTSIHDHGCAQWERVRLEGVFSLYDADGDGFMDAEEFGTMIRHILRTTRRDADSATVRRAVQVSGKFLGKLGYLTCRDKDCDAPEPRQAALQEDKIVSRHRVQKPKTGIRKAHFLSAASRGLFDVLGLPLHDLFRVPSFRQILAAHPSKANFRTRGGLKRLRMESRARQHKDARLRIDIPELSETVQADAVSALDSEGVGRMTPRRKRVRVNTGVQGASPRIIKYIPATGAFKPLPENLKAGHHHIRNAMRTLHQPSLTSDQSHAPSSIEGGAAGAVPVEEESLHSSSSSSSRTT